MKEYVLIMVEYKIIAEEENKRLGLFYRNQESGKFEFTNRYLSEGSLYISMLDYVVLSQKLPLTNLREYEVVRNFPFGPNGETGDDYIKKDINGVDLLMSLNKRDRDIINLKLVNWEKVISDSDKIFFNPNKPKKHYFGHIIRDINCNISVLIDKRKLISLDKAIEEGYILPGCPKKVLDLDNIDLFNFINPSSGIVFWSIIDKLDETSIPFVPRVGKNIDLDNYDWRIIGDIWERCNFTAKEYLDREYFEYYYDRI